MTPCWTTKDGYFQKIDTPLTPSCILAREIAENLKLSPDVSLYLRGSVLEENRPHPSADLDLVLVHGACRPHGRALEEVRDRFKSMAPEVDLSVVSMPELAFSAPHRLLLETRASLLSGPQKCFDRVASDRCAMEAHLEIYAPSFPPDTFVASKRSRVSVLKNLTRCFGVFRFTDGGGFTRDIATCLSYAAALDKNVAGFLVNAWRFVDEKVPLRLAPIKEFIRHSSRVRKLAGISAM